MLQLFNMDTGFCKQFQAAQGSMIVMVSLVTNTWQVPGFNPLHEAWCKDILFGTITMLYQKTMTLSLWCSMWAERMRLNSSNNCQTLVYAFMVTHIWLVNSDYTKLTNVQSRLIICTIQCSSFMSIFTTQDKYKRALAETENVRMRFTKQLNDAKLYSISGFCKDLLEVADILGKATSSVPQEALTGTDANVHLKNLYEGLVMTESQLQKVIHT